MTAAGDAPDVASVVVTARVADRHSRDCSLVVQESRQKVSLYVFVCAQRLLKMEQLSKCLSFVFLPDRIHYYYVCPMMTDLLIIFAITQVTTDSLLW